MVAVATVLISSVVAACGEAARDVEVLTIPVGSSLSVAADSLAAHGIIRWSRAFQLYGRMTRADRSIKAGVYRLPHELGWADAIEALVAGRTLPDALDVAPGSMVHTAGDSRRMLTNEGTGGGMTVNLNIAGTLVTDRDIVRIIRDEFQRGGFAGLVGAGR